MPRHITIGAIEKILQKEHSISRDTFYRDRNLSHTDDFSIPSDRLDVYAALLSVSPEELKNYTVKIRPLTDRKLSDFDKKIINKSGLKKP